MFVKIPFEKEIEFKTNISEITKMSLEHDFNVNDNVVLGNFYISGEYRPHEVSINTEDFKYTLPFEVNLREDINKDTLEFNIEDFSYDVSDHKILKVNIEYSLKAEINSDNFERVNESELESELNYIDDFLDNDNLKGDKDENLEKSSEKMETNEEEYQEELEIEEQAKDEVRLNKDNEKTIMDTIKDSDDTFVTYHIHIVKENETIESICAKYNVSSSLISEYNDIDSISLGDKILIPKTDE